ncbi:uncharacterized protein FRV6_16738 [Fusarium oxysporum]|uniref:Zn(2)-C6 fungal-type domain-containing protein n=1 Tax=Fusarium oxysporum TaxID=5507 RepID=A0A2H3U6T8_FUSOX|nr:uncharacterized protein FRV6_16738 [Fusarium oxysporum]
MSRRFRRAAKSRTGCRNCKQRHIKCDETTPSCVNCSTTHRHCSYLSLVPRTTPTSSQYRRVPVQQPGPSHPSLSLASASLACFPPAGLPFRSQALPDPTLDHTRVQQYSLQDMALLHHFQNGLAQSMVNLHPAAQQLFAQAAGHALVAPYLLNQILALSAAHLASVTGERRTILYRHQATAWQARALAYFNASTPDLDDSRNCVSMFFFSVFLGYQAIFETLSILDDFTGFLDSFISCIGLLRGVRTITDKSWQILEHQLMPSMDPRCSSNTESNQAAEPRRASNLAKGDECRPLIQRLDAADAELDSETVSVCRRAAHCLQASFDACRASPSRHARIVLSCTTFLEKDFIDLVRSQQPEAILILAYYGVMLHSISDIWMVDEAGRNLVRSVTAHLGSDWEKWLVWPKTATLQ